MESVKMPYVPEDSLRTQRVEIYLQDLKERLNELRLQHDEVIHNSVVIIKEIDEVSSTLLLTQNSVASTREEHLTKIKKLILDFETSKEKCCTKTPVVVENHVDIRKILQEFERLNDSQLLKDSLILFRKAKESLEKIDTLLGGLKNNNKVNNNSEFKKLNISESIRGTIDKLNRTKLQMELETIASTNIPNVECYANAVPSKPEDVPVAKQNSYEQLTDVVNDTISNYASCCSSLVSIQRYESTSNDGGNKNTCKSSLNGYEGDNDESEHDMFSLKFIKK